MNDVVYADLLAHALPRVIETDAGNERMIAELEKLDDLPRKTREQKPLTGRTNVLLTVLIRQFETRCDLGHAEPLEALKSLMEDRGLRQRDLISVFGSGSVASDVLSGKSEISKQHARRLSEFFSVPVGIFI